MQTTRTIQIEVPESSARLLERVAEREYSTLQSFVQQRVADLIKFIRASKTRSQLPAAENEADVPGMYL